MLELHASDKLPVRYSGKYKGSFAYVTVKDRLPVILVKVLDTLCQDINSIGLKHGEDGKEEVKKVIGRLSALQNEMITNKPIKYLVSDGPDVPIWNMYFDLQNSKNNFVAAWFDSSWLYVECYLYRRIKEAFELSSLLKDYDPFHKQKVNSLQSSMDSIRMLGHALQKSASDLQNISDSSDMYNLFTKYLEISLWGNKCDLSISAGKENIQENWQVEELGSKILVNDSEKIWKLLKEANKSGDVHVHFVLDNAGFELFCDFCLIHFLDAMNLVKKISIHVKEIPWFVSDTLRKDIDYLLETLTKTNDEVLVKLGKHWLSKLSSQEWTVSSQPFWTLPHDFSKMASADLQLYSELSASSLIIFKGDLNYRKLTGDRQWEETTSFETALNKFLPTSLVTLRTIKADVVVGLEHGTTEKLNRLSSNWKFSGEYALIQFAEKIDK